MWDVKLYYTTQYCTRTDLTGNKNTVVPNVRSFRHYILPLNEEKTHEAASTSRLAV